MGVCAQGGSQLISIRADALGAEPSWWDPLLVPEKHRTCSAKMIGVPGLGRVQGAMYDVGGAKRGVAALA